MYRARLKKGTSIPEFLKAAIQCTENIFYVTDEGDRLNLRSTLSQFVFTFAVGNDSVSPIHHGFIEFEHECDYQILQNYIE